MNADSESTSPAPAAGVPLVYKAINEVMAEMAKYGISKDRKNQQQGYSFRGIDDVYNALCPAMSEAGLCMLPRVINRTTSERPTQKGGVLFYVVCEVEYDLVSTEDGSRHTIRVIGEAMDSADKATNKAMSAAYKYAAIQAFAIPVEGNPDADAETPEPAAASQAMAPPKNPPIKNNGVSNPNGQPFGMAKANEIVALMEEARSVDELKDISDNQIVIRKWTDDAKRELRCAYAAIKERIETHARN